MIATTSRRGVTLTEILISIMIMGVGMTALATLFPLGLLRLRDAQRFSRSATLTESAAADLEARDLLNKRSFLNTNTGPYYNLAAYTPWPYDPWVQDTPGYAGGRFLDPIAGPNFGAYRGTGVFNQRNPAGHDLAAPRYNPGQGLPVAYDPLWRHAAGVYPGHASEARFASGIGFVRQDPDGGAPSAHGLQRITNFPAGTLMNVPDIFVSPEDVVLQSDKDAGGGGVGAKSPIAPDLTTGGTNALTGMLEPMNEWRYTWMFTGQQADCTNGSVFTGDVVVFENRPWSLDPVTLPFGGASSYAAAGETVVEAVFGYTNRVTTTNTAGYGMASNRAVLLRWPASMPDPEIRVGQWIADVTYERNALTDYTRAYVDPTTGGANGYYPYQRCYWYQIAKRTEAGPAANQWDGDAADMREMTVWTNSPLRALTLLRSSGGVNVVGSPIHVNAALVSPYVVNVFPRTIYTR